MSYNYRGINYLSYSGFVLYNKCPYAYWHKYCNKTHLNEPENCVNSLYGSTVGLIFEAFYRDKLWKLWATRTPEEALKHLEGLVEPYLESAIASQKKNGLIVDWADPTAIYSSRGELVADAIETIQRGVNTIRKNDLLGPVMETETKLDCKFDNYTIGGRSDFLIKRRNPHNDLVILDGKGSKHRDKYVDGQARKEGAPIEGKQLKWYGLLHRKKFNVVPDKLGYIFWKFERVEAVEWVDFSVESLDTLQREVLATVRRIDTSYQKLLDISHPESRDELRQELFISQPGFGCNLCPYVPFCEDGQKETKTRPATSGRIELPPGVSELTL